MTVALFKRNAKPAVAMTPERQALAEAIAAVRQIEAAIAANLRTRAEADEKIDAAFTAVARAEAAHERLGGEAVDFVRKRAAGEAVQPAALKRRGPTPTQVKARSEHELATWRAVREATFSVASELSSELECSARARDEALAAVIRSEASLLAHPLLDRLEALQAEERAVSAALKDVWWSARLRFNRYGDEPNSLEERYRRILGSLGAIVTSAKVDYSPPGYEVDPTHLMMQAAFARLANDAAAPLPTPGEVTGG